MSKKKKFLVYLSVFLLAIVAIIGGCFAIMFLSPGTEILGYEYILLNQKETITLTSADISGMKAIKITSDLSSISIYPSLTDDITITYNQNISGYVKSVNADYNISTKKQNQYFSVYSDSTEELTTMVIKISEPKGWLSYEESKIRVSIPQTAYKAIYASCSKSNVTLTSSQTYIDSETKLETIKNISCEHLFLQSGGDGDVTVLPNETFKTFNLQTEYGSAKISGQKELSAEQIIFSTNSGEFDFYNNGEGKLILSKGMVINATGSPTVNFCNIKSDLSISTNGGNFSLGNVGQEGSPYEVKILSNGANFSISSLYGLILSEGVNGQSNNISINYLNSSTDDFSTIHSGTGNITINTLESNASLTSTSGNITIYEVSVDSSLYAYSSSGDVSINYIASETFHNGTFLQVFTKSGNVKLTNLSCKLELSVLNDSPQKSCELSFTAICNSTDGTALINKIEAPSRDVKITFISAGAGLSSRILTTKVVDFDSSMSVLWSKVNTNDADCILDEYDGYSNQYRLFYNNPAEAEEGKIDYNGYGILLVKSKSTTVDHYLPV